MIVKHNFPPEQYETVDVPAYTLGDLFRTMLRDCQNAIDDIGGKCDLTQHRVQSFGAGVRLLRAIGLLADGEDEALLFYEKNLFDSCERQDKKAATDALDGLRGAISTLKQHDFRGPHGRTAHRPKPLVPAPPGPDVA